MTIRILAMLVGSLVLMTVAPRLSWSQDDLPQTPPSPLTDIRLRPLTPDLVPPFPRQPFNWGRFQEFHRRTGRSSCGIPLGDYDRTIPSLVVSAISFRTTGPETIKVPRGSVSSLGEYGRSGTTVYSKLAIVGIDPTATEPPPTADGTELIDVRSKRFTLRVRELAVPPFILDRVGVIVYEDGRFRGSGYLFHTGGVASSDRGAEVKVTVRGLAAGSRLDVDPLSQGVVTLWSISDSVWVPRGGPMPISLDDPYLRRQIAASFDEVTHVEVTLAPRDIR